MDVQLIKLCWTGASILVGLWDMQARTGPAGHRDIPGGYKKYINSARFVGGWVYPLWCLSTAKFSLTPTGLVKNTLKYIADPPVVLRQIEYSIISMS